MITTLSKFLAASIIGIITILSACEVESQKEDKPGLVLTVDDGHIDQWFEYIDYMAENNVKLTFYLTKYQYYSEEKKQKVKELIAQGHEMAYHSTNHICFSEFINYNTIEEYLQIEILEGLNALEIDNIIVNNFAYPCGSSSPGSDSIIKDYFNSIRKIAWVTSSIELDSLNSIFYKVPCDKKIIRGHGIDNVYDISIDQIYSSLDRTISDNLALVLFCHKISEDSLKYNISFEKFDSIVKYCQSNYIPFMTVNELYGIEATPSQ